MKSIIKNDVVNKELGFPKLMVDKDGMVILFTDVTTGTVVVGKGSFTIGEWGDEWYITSFEDFNGTVELSN